MKTDKVLVVLGATIIAATFAALCFQIHWAVGSTITGMLLMIAGCIYPNNNKNK